MGSMVLATALTAVGCNEKHAEPSAGSASGVPSAASSGGASGVASVPSETTRLSASALASAAAAGGATPTSSGSGATSAPEAITAQHILVAYKGAKTTPSTITRSKEDARKRAEEVAKKAHAPGADFTALVTEYSDDPNAKARQGSLGKFTRDRMVRPFSDAAFALHVDEVSGVVETPFGFHVIKRNQ